MSDHHLVTDWCDTVEKNIAWVLDPAAKRATHTFSAHHNVPAKQQGVSGGAGHPVQNVSRVNEQGGRGCAAEEKWTKAMISPFSSGGWCNFPGGGWSLLCLSGALSAT